MLSGQTLRGRVGLSKDNAHSLCYWGHYPANFLVVEVKPCSPMVDALWTVGLRQHVLLLTAAAQGSWFHWCGSTGGTEQAGGHSGAVWVLGCWEWDQYLCGRRAGLQLREEAPVGQRSRSGGLYGSTGDVCVCRWDFIGVKPMERESKTIRAV